MEQILKPSSKPVRWKLSFDLCPIGTPLSSPPGNQLDEESSLSFVAQITGFSSLCPVYIGAKPAHEVGLLSNGAVVVQFGPFGLKSALPYHQRVAQRQSSVIFRHCLSVRVAPLSDGITPT